MTEAFEDGNYLVRVRAQVMTRDDSTGGWVPMGGGGLSNVSVRKRGIPSETIPDDTKHEYFIYGKRISDQSVVLSCVIKKDFEYNKVMPTFHHWKTGDKKFGLTFQTAADARAFDKGVRTAVEELLDVFGDMTAVLSWPARQSRGVTSLSGLMVLGSRRRSPVRSCRYSHHHQTKGLAGTLSSRNIDVGDDDVFMTLNLPVERGDSRSSSDSSSGRPPLAPPQPPPAPVPDPESYSYVQLTAVHDYMYPVVDAGGSLKKQTPQPEPPNKQKERCRHCQEAYSSENNVRGSCAYAPDRIRSGIEAIACVACARCVLYHCSDTDTEPCDCSTCQGPGCGRRWIALAILSLVVPCLWCYPPLRACHFCCVSCGLCGGKHRPAS